VRIAAVLLFLALGCDPIEVGSPSTPTPDPAPMAQADPGDAPCTSLSREACLRSVVCTLDAPSDQGSNRYTCREARGNCEIGLTQTRADRDRCDDRDGCAWADGRCYCACRGSGRTEVEDGPEAEPCDCECGGGPPAGCRAR
jgi:hypothetical protein